jgi:hypothetical protein
MISIDCDVSVSTFPPKEIGYWTLVRAYKCKFQFDVTNDGAKPLHGLNFRPVVESYVGQEKPQLFQWLDTQVIEIIPPNNLVPIKFELKPHFPGVVSVALYVTDAASKTVMAKRKEKSSYEEAPVRWWFYVVDDISLEILQELKKLVAIGEETRK